MITVTAAPPYITVQDTGRVGSRAAGVPRGGAMDRYALEALNAILGNPAGSAVLEWALGGGKLRFDDARNVAIGGASVAATLGGIPIAGFTAFRATKGDELEIKHFTSGRFLYIGVEGGILVPKILGSRSTYLPGHFGGYAGRTVGRGDVLDVGESVSSGPRRGFTPDRTLLPAYDSDVIRVTRGSHADLLGDLAWETFTNTSFRVGTASDRTGYRLTGTVMQGAPANLPSDASCEGAVQIPSEGAPIVLMADAPTVGGYPKIAVVAEADLPIFAQRTPGQTVRFKEVTVEESQRALRQRVLDLKTVRSTGAAPA